MARRKPKMHWARKRKITQGILIALTVILGLGVITLTGKVLDNKYQWVEKARDRFGLPTEDVDDLSSDEVPAVSEGEE